MSARERTRGKTGGRGFDQIALDLTCRFSVPELRSQHI